MAGTGGYTIAELRPGEAGGFRPRGAVRDLWKTRDFEVVVSGPAECGKTWGILQYLDALLWKYAGAQAVMCRKVYATLNGSCVRTYRRILGPATPVKAYGGEQPQWFDYPNGSRLWLAGMDNPGKALSSERDVIYVNQAEELALPDWATLTTRCTGRGAVMPYTRLIGDANPGPPQHWIKQREAEGALRLLEARHQDNPTLYTDAGELTEQGRKTMGILDALPGVLRMRLRFGRWAAAEGVVYDGFDAAYHVLQPPALPARRYVMSKDWGFTNPGVLQAWAVDGDGRMTLVHEVYRSGRTIDWWVEQAVELDRRFRPEAFVADPAEPSFITMFRTAGLQVVPGFNDIRAGVQAVQARLRRPAFGGPRLALMADALADRDESLAEARLPTSTREEFDAYVWPKGQDGRPNRERPVDAANHGLDALRYAVAYVDGIGRATWRPESVDLATLYNDL